MSHSQEWRVRDLVFWAPYLALMVLSQCPALREEYAIWSLCCSLDADSPFLMCYSQREVRDFVFWAADLMRMVLLRCPTIRKCVNF
ncbi:hypothetical protein EDB19DRAFT_1733002 [Suillus lakei]|nr:hypothetical protein EDB19DRAFT_1733002 [Suillus lakei]